jgi:asparagine synthase (glutamine-hydrolysing)
MCGIFLVISKKKKVDKKNCLSILENLKKRGPDDSKYGFYNDGLIFIGNTILNITGKLNKKLRSPIKSQTSRYHIAFNGEIYNYKKLAKKYLKIEPNNEVSDTKILVNLHEKLKPEQIPILLDGMFAYITYDKITNEIIIANDTQGEKNLYMYQSKNEIIFSSNISSILKFNPKIKFNKTEIKNYFVTRHLTPFNNTCYKNIKVLNPGSFLKVNALNLNIKKELFENPIDWIDVKKFKANYKLSELSATNKIENILINQAKKMIPKRKFACIFSGGIDSSLQSAIINKIKKPNILATLHHDSKDEITKCISKFQKFFKTKIFKINITPIKYFNDLISIYKNSMLPVYTHSVVGIHQISKFFKKKKCKVYFAADGADELFGGYKIYEDLDWKSNNLSLSPYSSINKNILKKFKIKDKKYNQKINDFRRRVKIKYSFLKNREEINIQTNLFCDYFIQSVKVGNACNDMIGSDNSIEIRNIFVQKDVIKEIINMPAKFKINLNNKKEFKTKIILKNLFVKYFDKEYVFKKQGFSGFPNEINKKSIMKFNHIIKMFNKRIVKKFKIYKDVEWKFINIDLFKDTILNKTQSSLKKKMN